MLLGNFMTSWKGTYSMYNIILDIILACITKYWQEEFLIP